MPGNAIMKKLLFSLMLAPGLAFAGFTGGNQASTAVTVTGAAQPAITSVGTLTVLAVAGAVTSAGKVTVPSARAVNTSSALATVTISAGIASTYIDLPAAAITVTLAAPAGDGERRRVCFGAATTVTWSVTAPATTSDSLPTAIIASQCVEMIYNSVAGTPTNSAATNWYLF